MRWLRVVAFASLLSSHIDRICFSPFLVRSSQIGALFIAMSAISAHKKAGGGGAGGGGGGAAAAGSAASAVTATPPPATEQLGMEYLNAGLKLEMKGDRAAAIETYHNALQILLQVLKATPDTQSRRDDRDRIKKLLTTYMSRAEGLKKQQNDAEAAAAAAAEPAPAMIQTKQKATKSGGGYAASTAASAAKLRAKVSKKGGAAAAAEEAPAAAAAAEASTKSDDSKIDPVLRKMIEGEILDNGVSASSSYCHSLTYEVVRSSFCVCCCWGFMTDGTDTKVSFADVQGLADVKQALHEMVILPALRPDLFSGLRRPPNGLLMYGPPGNGKTFIAKAVANEAKCTFFSISAASLVSRWLGDSEKLVRTLFAIARERAPSIIFIDEIDSVLGKRKDGEHDAARRLKTEFLIQFDGAGNGSGGSGGGGDGVVVIGATNIPESLDDAVIRRLNKQIFVPSPDAATRASLLLRLLSTQKHSLKAADIERIVKATEYFSASDLTALAREAAYGPIRELGSVAAVVAASITELKPISVDHFMNALKTMKPSVSAERMKQYEAFKKQTAASS